MSSIDPSGRLLRREETSVPTTNGAGTIRETRREATRRIAQEAVPVELLSKIITWGVVALAIALGFLTIAFIFYLGVTILRGIL